MDKIFAKGLFVKEAKPEWIVCTLNIKGEDFIQFIRENINENGWLSLDVKWAKNPEKGMFAEKNDWTPNKGRAEHARPAPSPDGFNDDIPF